MIHYDHKWHINRGVFYAILTFLTTTGSVKDSIDINNALIIALTSKDTPSVIIPLLDHLTRSFLLLSFPAQIPGSIGSFCYQRIMNKRLIVFRIQRNYSNNSGFCFLNFFSILEFNPVQFFKDNT